MPSVRKVDGLICVAVDGETVVYCGATEALHRLDPIATAVWDTIVDGGSVEALLATLSGAFGVAEQDLADDLHVLLGTLEQARLLCLDA